jgi:hypothetical protein
MGGPYIRIFRDLYPNEVKGTYFLIRVIRAMDATGTKTLMPKEQIKLVLQYTGHGTMGVYNQLIPGL